MANDIARNFASEPDHAEAVTGISTHLRRFWEPRMRAGLIAHWRENGGTDLHELAREAVAKLAES